MAKNKKSPLNTDLDADHDDIEEPEVIEEEDQADDTIYTMGDILVDDGNGDEDVDEQKILSQASGNSSSNDSDDDSDDVWVDDVDVFDSKDEYLDLQDYDPEEAYYD